MGSIRSLPIIARAFVVAVMLTVGIGTAYGVSPPTAHASGGTITAGDIIVSDDVNDRVDEYTSSGTLVQTLVDSTEGLQEPTGTVLDSAGNLYVADFTGNQILKRTPAGVVSVFSNDTILADGRQYLNPESIALSSNGSEMYISDTCADATCAAGTVGINVINAATGTGAAFLPTGRSDWLAFDKTGNLFMTDESADIFQVNTATGALRTFVSGLPCGSAFGISFDNNGNLWVADKGIILEYNASGSLVYPSSVICEPDANYFAAVFNSTATDFYVGDLLSGKVYIYDTNGMSQGSFSTRAACGGNAFCTEALGGLSVVGGFVPTAARTSRLGVQRHGASIVFRWRVASASGIAGFDLYAAGHRVNARLIHTHPSRAYAYRARWPGRGPFHLSVILTSGRRVSAEGSAVGIAWRRAARVRDNPIDSRCGDMDAGSPAAKRH